MRTVSIVGIGQVPVETSSSSSLAELGASVVQMAMEDASVSQVDALFAGNMLSDEMQGQKHIAALIADEAGLIGIEALQVRAAMASGAAALRMAFLAVASGEADLAVAVGVEKMSEGVAEPALSKALDVRREVPDGATMISRNADLMRMYMERYKVPEDGFVNFPVIAHTNAKTNPMALFRKGMTPRKVRRSRVVYPQLRLMHCSPICDGAAAVMMAPTVAAIPVAIPIADPAGVAVPAAAK